LRQFFINTYQERQREWPCEALATSLKEKVPIPIFRLITGEQISQINAKISYHIQSSSDLPGALFCLPSLE